MDNAELRKKDFITSILLVTFGFFLIFYTLSEIPMKDSWGGVMNVWYVSPGLFPVSIGLLIILMGGILCQRAIKDGGARKFFKTLSHGRRGSSEKTLRLFGILLVMFAYVYLLIPRVDYFLSTMLTLMVFISLFFLDGPGFLKKLFIFYLTGCLFLLTLFLLGFHHSLQEWFLYGVDLIVFLFFLTYILYAKFLIRGDGLLKKKWKTSLIMSIAPSLFLIPSFKYFLLVPLPVEGGFIELMNVIRYALRS